MATRTVYLTVIQGSRQHPWYLEAKRWMVVLKWLICTWFLNGSMCFYSLVFSLLLRFATLPWNLGFLHCFFPRQVVSRLLYDMKMCDLMEPNIFRQVMQQMLQIEDAWLILTWHLSSQFCNLFSSDSNNWSILLNLSNWSKCFSPSPTFCLSFAIMFFCITVSIFLRLLRLLWQASAVKKAKWRVQFRRSTWNTELQSNFIQSLLSSKSLEQLVLSSFRKFWPWNRLKPV